jgi:hypothetical protein
MLVYQRVSIVQSALFFVQLTGRAQRYVHAKQVPDPGGQPGHTLEPLPVPTFFVCLFDQSIVLWCSIFCTQIIVYIPYYVHTMYIYNR